jgi:hypothetical protein
LNKAWIGGAVLALALAGCEYGRSGVVVSSRPPILLHYPEFLPRIEVECVSGKTVRLDKIGGPFFVIGFIEPPGRDAGYISPVLVEMARELRLDSIEVIQITLPTKACPLDAAQREGCEEPRKNFSRFFDPDRVAWAAFWKPKPGTILLVNRFSLIPVIDKRSTVDDPKPIVNRAKDFQRRWDAMYPNGSLLGR